MQQHRSTAQLAPVKVQNPVRSVTLAEFPRGTFIQIERKRTAAKTYRATQPTLARLNQLVQRLEVQGWATIGFAWPQTGWRIYRQQVV